MTNGACVEQLEFHWAYTHPVAGNYSLVSFSSVTSKKYVHCDTNAVALARPIVLPTTEVATSLVSVFVTCAQD